mmetsp:Transcript_39999/g.110113  ORF Transcript_39999/g.110113 Transcript_39999/m.110113 type:complete len:404 (+) Transcript_39999:102-1313(+)
MVSLDSCRKRLRSCSVPPVGSSTPGAPRPAAHACVTRRPRNLTQPQMRSVCPKSPPGNCLNSNVALPLASAMRMMFSLHKRAPARSRMSPSRNSQRSRESAGTSSGGRKMQSTSSDSSSLSSASRGVGASAPCSPPPPSSPHMAVKSCALGNFHNSSPLLRNVNSCRTMPGDTYRVSAATASGRCKEEPGPSVSGVLTRHNVPSPSSDTKSGPFAIEPRTPAINVSRCLRVKPCIHATSESMCAKSSSLLAVSPKPPATARTSRKSLQNLFERLVTGKSSAFMTGSRHKYAFKMAATSSKEKKCGCLPKCTCNPVDSFVAAHNGGDRKAFTTSQKRVTSHSSKRMRFDTISTGKGLEPSRGSMVPSAVAVQRRPQSHSSAETRRQSARQRCASSSPPSRPERR